MSSSAPAYIVAARRTAIGKIGGLHRSRKLADLAAPIVTSVLEDAKIAPDRVDEVIVGNGSEGHNPARLIALAAGIPEKAGAITLDRQCASGLDAIVTAARMIGAGEAEVIVAGGAESLSTAPWQIARPRSLHQMPRFIDVEPRNGHVEDGHAYELIEAFARLRGISRERQDAYVLNSHLRAEIARTGRRFIGEITPLRSRPEEARDESAVEPSFDDLAELAPYAPNGTLTAGNTIALHDGAAFVVVVSEAVWTALGSAPALRVVAAATQGVAPKDEASAPVAAIRKLFTRCNGFDRSGVGRYEIGETSAAQAISLIEELALDPVLVNPDGGAIVRGHPVSAAGAVLAVRLFTAMARERGAGSPQFAVASLGASGGMGIAVLFEAA